MFADSGAIERLFFLLLKRYLQTTGICFYDYQSFEQLLPESLELSKSELSQWICFNGNTKFSICYT